MSSLIQDIDAWFGRARLLEKRRREIISGLDSILAEEVIPRVALMFPPKYAIDTRRSCAFSCGKSGSVPSGFGISLYVIYEGAKIQSCTPRAEFVGELREHHEGILRGMKREYGLEVIRYNISERDYFPVGENISD